MIRLVFCLLVLASIDAGPAAALPRQDAARDAEPMRSISYSLWSIEGSTVRLRFILPQRERINLVPIAAPRPTTDEVGGAIRAKLGVSAGGQTCPPIDQGEGFGDVYTMAQQPGVDRFEIVFACAARAPLTLHDHLLFDRVRGHVNYALITSGTIKSVGLFTPGKQDLAIAPGSSGVSASLPALFAEGARWRTISGIALGLLAGLILLIGRRRDLLHLGLGLGAGYSLSLVLIGSGLFEPVARRTAVAGAALIALFGSVGLASRFATIFAAQEYKALAWFAMLGCLVVAIALPLGVTTALMVAGLGLFCGAMLLLGDAGRQNGLPMLGLSALSGLIEGMAPAQDLRPLDLPKGQLIPTIASYDLGSAACAMAIAALTYFLLSPLTNRLVAARNVLKDGAGAGLVGAGMFLYVSQILN